MELKDRVAIITGGNSGIGKAAALRFVREGARVAIIGLNDEKGFAAEEELRACADQTRAGDGYFIRADVSSPEEVQQAVKSVMERWGRIDIVANNAAMMTHDPIDKLSIEDWDKVINVNLRSVFLLTKYTAEHMHSGGSIVNISSVHASATGAGASSYCASKGGMEAFTRAASIEFFKRKIRVNVIRPGAVDTGMLWENPSVKSGAEKIVASEVGQPSEIAEAILFLASERASFVTGAVLNVDGGRLALLGSHGE